MPRRRVLMAIRPCRLREDLCAELDAQTALKVVDLADSHIEILVATRSHRADVVVAPVELGPGIPLLVRTLLSYFPELIVLGIDLHGERACLYRTRIDEQVFGELSASALVDAVVSQPAQRRRPRKG